MQAKISHIEINVLDYAKAIRFYDILLPPIGFNRVTCMKNWAAYSDEQTKFIVCPTEEKYKEFGFHRKKSGLNHLAFYAPTKEAVDKYYKEILIPNRVNVLYEKRPFGDNDYYAVFFEGPDRLKLEYVYSPNYCNPKNFPSNLEDDFDPYSEIEIF